MLEKIDEVCGDTVSRNLFNLLSEGWLPIKVLITKLCVDRHTAYRRFKALEKFNLIRKSRRKHESSRYKIYGFNLTNAGKILVKEFRSTPSISFELPIHSFKQNYIADVEALVYPNTKTVEFSSNVTGNRLRMGVCNMLMELMRDPKLEFGEFRLIVDCKFKPVAELDVYEFYRQCLGPCLESYIKNRTFAKEKDLAVRISGSSGYTLNLIKLARFLTECYGARSGKENTELIIVALDKAHTETKTKSEGWGDRVSPLIINAYLFMLASIYHTEGRLPEPELYFELWYLSIGNLKKLKNLYAPLLNDLQRKVA
jgi:DNA-binding MarR family transcriptional regulator